LKRLRETFHDFKTEDSAVSSLLEVHCFLMDIVIEIGNEYENRKNILPLGYFAVSDSVQGQPRKLDTFPTSITSCSSRQMADLTQSSSAQSLEHPVHTDYSRTTGY
jgi:hypothetical protein